MVKIKLVGEEEDISWSDLYTPTSVCVYISWSKPRFMYPASCHNSTSVYCLDRLPASWATLVRFLKWVGEPG